MAKSRKKMRKMITTTLFDGTTKEEFLSESEYNARLYELQRSLGRSKLFYHGWLNGQLVIMHR
jgi:hypothetical protein